MKKTLLITFLIIFTSCKKKEVISDISREKTEINTIEFGKEIFEGKGMCATCHKENAKASGPSIKEIALIYKNKKASITEFLQGETEPIVNPSQYEIMKINLELTKTMTMEELKALEDYMMSFK